MSCPTEFKCAVYADGELAESETREIAAHLAECSTCRRLVESLQVESRVLLECFQDTEFLEFELEDEHLSAPAADSLSATRFAAFVLAMSVLLRPVFGALEEIRFPLSASAQFNLLVDGVMYGIPSTIAFVESFLNVASWIVATGIVCFGLFVIFRRYPVVSALLGVFALLTVFSPSSYAIDVRRGDKPVTVPPGETIDDTLVVTGDSVNVDGTINGDLIAFVREVRVQGTVRGNLISFAERAEIDGSVEGSIVAAGGFVEMRGQAARNLYALAGSVNIGRQGRIDGNATMLIGEASLEGNIGQDFTAYTARSTGWGPFSGRMFGHGGSVRVLPPAHIGRNLFAKVDETENAIVDSAVSVGGKTNIQATPPSPNRYATASFYVWQTIWLAAALITGLVLFRLVPAFGHVSLTTGREILVTAGIGFITAVATPVAAFIAGLTLIGLPLALMTIGLWTAAAYVSKIVIAGFVGRSLLANSGRAHAIALTLLAGLVPIFVATNLPYVGGVINLLLIVLGFGALVMTTYRMPRWHESGRVTALTA